MAGRVWPWNSSISEPGYSMASAPPSALLSGTVPSGVLASDPALASSGLGGSALGGGSFGTGLLDFNSAGVAFTQAEFERLMDTADAKQAGIANFQWNLIRDQFGAFARETAAIRQELARSQMQSQENVRLVQLLQAELESEAVARARDDQATLTSMNQFKVAFETMDKEGRACNIKIEDLMRALEAEMQERCRSFGTLDSKCQEALQSLKSLIEADRGERIEDSRTFRSAMDKEVRNREVVAMALEQERSERLLMGRSLEERCAATREHAEKCFKEAREAICQERLSRESQNMALAGDLQVKEARLRAEDAALKEQLEEAVREIRRELERVAQESDNADARLRASQDALQNSLETKFRETATQFSDQLSRTEQELKAELARAAEALQAEDKRIRGEVEQLDADLRGEIGRALQELLASINDLGANVERRFALVDEAAQAEKNTREGGDAALCDRLDLLQRAMKDDVRQETANREAEELELKSAMETLRRGLSAEEQQRSDQAKRLWEAVDTHTHQVQQPPQPMMVMEQLIPQIGSTSVVAARAQKIDGILQVTDGRPRLGSMSPSTRIQMPSPTSAGAASPISPMQPMSCLPGSMSMAVGSTQVRAVRSYGGGASYGV